MHTGVHLLTPYFQFTHTHTHTHTIFLGGSAVEKIEPHVTVKGLKGEGCREAPSSASAPPVGSQVPQLSPAAAAGPQPCPRPPASIQSGSLNPHPQAPAPRSRDSRQPPRPQHVRRAAKPRFITSESGEEPNWPINVVR